MNTRHNSNISFEEKLEKCRISVEVISLSSPNIPLGHHGRILNKLIFCSCSPPSALSLPWDIYKALVLMPNLPCINVISYVSLLKQFIALVHKGNKRSFRFELWCVFIISDFSTPCCHLYLVFFDIAISLITK